MPYRKTDHTQTVDFTVIGEPPLEMPFTGGKHLHPSNVRVVIRDGALDVLWVSGLAYNQTGKLGKRAAEALIGEAVYAPDWLRQLVAELGLSWSDGEPAAAETTTTTTTESNEEQR